MPRGTATLCESLCGVAYQTAEAAVCAHCIVPYKSNLLALQCVGVLLVHMETSVGHAATEVNQRSIWHDLSE